MYLCDIVAARDFSSLFLLNRLIERQDVFNEGLNLRHCLETDPQIPGNLIVGRETIIREPKFVLKIPYAKKFLMGVHRQANDSGFVTYRALQGLLDPPARVRRK